MKTISVLELLEMLGKGKAPATINFGTHEYKWCIFDANRDITGQYFRFEDRPLRRGHKQMARIIYTLEDDMFRWHGGFGDIIHELVEIPDEEYESASEDPMYWQSSVDDLVLRKHRGPTSLPKDAKEALEEDLKLAEELKSKHATMYKCEPIWKYEPTTTTGTTAWESEPTLKTVTTEDKK